MLPLLLRLPIVAPLLLAMPAVPAPPVMRPVLLRLLIVPPVSFNKRIRVPALATPTTLPSMVPLLVIDTLLTEDPMVTPVELASMVPPWFSRSVPLPVTLTPSATPEILPLLLIDPTPVFRMPAMVVGARTGQ